MTTKNLAQETIHRSTRVHAMLLKRETSCAIDSRPSIMEQLSEEFTDVVTVFEVIFTDYVNSVSGNFTTSLEFVADDDGLQVSNGISISECGQSL